MLGHNERHLSAVRRWPAGKRSAAVLFTESRLAGRFFSCGAGELNLPRSGSTIFNSGLLHGIRVFSFSPSTKNHFLSITYCQKIKSPSYLHCSISVYILVSTHQFVFVGVNMTQETDEERKNRLREQGSANLRALFSNRFDPQSNIYTGIYGNEFDAQILLKLDKRLKVAFQKTCEENGVTVSRLLRDFMREYVRAYHP